MPENNPSSEEATPPELTDELHELTHQIKKQNSFFRSFMKGIFQGVGTAVGAVLITSVILYWVWGILESTGVTEYINPSFLQEMITPKE